MSAKKQGKKINFLSLYQPRKRISMENDTSDSSNSSDSNESPEEKTKLDKYDRGSRKKKDDTP